MILVLQFRTDQSGPHEIKCLYSKINLQYNKILFVNALSELFTIEFFYSIIKHIDAVIIAGLGEGGFEKPPKNFDKLLELMEKVTKKLFQLNKPTLGICFGHQLIAYFNGAKIKQDKNQAETGITKIQIISKQSDDLIFNGLTNSFLSVEGHKSSIVKIPNNAINLATSKKHEFQLLKYSDKIYTTQFHPELNYKDLIERLKLYPEYKKNSLDTNYKKVTSEKILYNFIHLIAT